MSDGRVWYDPLKTAVRAATYIFCHTFIGVCTIAAARIIALILKAAGDPKLYDLFPMRYLFDTIDLSIFLAYMVSGSISAWNAFKEEPHG